MLRKTKRRTESRLEAVCVKWARQRGVLVSKLTDPAGFPDRAFWVDGGRPVLVEFKDPLGTATELQKTYQRRLLELGYSCVEVRTWQHFRDLIGGYGVKE